jgi:hypothetical protein
MIKKHTAELAALREKIAEIEGTAPRDMWIHDLNSLSV